MRRGHIGESIGRKGEELAKEQKRWQMGGRIVGLVEVLTKDCLNNGRFGFAAQALAWTGLPLFPRPRIPFGYGSL